MANQLWCIDFLAPPTPLIIPHWLHAFLESLMPLKNWCYIHARCYKTVWSISYVSVAFFPSLKQNFIAYFSSKVSSCPDCIFEIYQLWQSCFSCLLEPEIIKIGLSSHKMYSNNILSFQDSTAILNACTKKSGNLLNAPSIFTPCTVLSIQTPSGKRIEANQNLMKYLCSRLKHYVLLPFRKNSKEMFLWD